MDKSRFKNIWKNKYTLLKTRLNQKGWSTSEIARNEVVPNDINQYFSVNIGLVMCEFPFYPKESSLVRKAHTA